MWKQPSRFVARTVALSLGAVLFGCAASTGPNGSDAAADSATGDTGSTDTGTPDATAPDAPPGDGSTSNTSTLTNSCGPADGPAFVLTVSRSPLTCPTLMATGTYDSITIYTDIPTSPSGVAITGSSGGAATSCVGGTCRPGSRASIDFTAVSPSSASGSYTITFADGSSVSGRFAAVRCNNPRMCG